jgi:hypothetical protein
MDIKKTPSPCFVLDESLLRKNLALIHHVEEQAGVQIILAFKGFAMWSAFPIVREYLRGWTLLPNIWLVIKSGIRRTCHGIFIGIGGFKLITN